MDPLSTFLLFPLALGLLGFVEPCSIGASLLFLKSVEGNPAAVRLMQAIVFTATRALFIGVLGAAAAIVGAAFIGFQRAGYVALGALYLAIGALYLTGRAGALMRTLGPGLARLSTVRGSAALAVLFGLNIPACAAPLLAGVLGAAAVGGPAQIGRGFVTLAVFGLGLSLPLLAALALGPAQRLLETLSRGAARVPMLIGIVFVAIGLASIWFGATVSFG
jgi:cytochrome c-type biogenesis protein